METIQALSAFLLVFLTSSALSQETVEYRLPTIILPVHYNVHLNLTPEVFTDASSAYSGYMVITFTTAQSTNIIRLHASNSFINVTHITVASIDLTSDQWSIDPTTDILTITLPANMTATTATRELYIEFDSRLSTSDMYGFYKSSYVDSQNVTRYLATTQFQPTFARRAFPCFDEPSFKATFDIYITYPSDMNVLGNTPGSFFDTDGWGDANGTLSTVLFQRTPIMSSYLLAFVVSNFTCTSGDYIETNGTEPIIPYRICSQDDLSATRGWAVDIGPGLLRSLNNWTGIDFSEHGIDKVDQVAIPDFAAGAMENWGLVTYREVLLLYDPLHTPNLDQERIATIISHEFAHFWFGNLVTCRWWSELFLNEGFATYFEAFTTHDVFPEWELDKRFVTSYHQAVLVADSSLTAPALQSERNSDAEVLNTFNSISYSKGGSVLRMVEHIMGTENFKAGINEYLNNHRFSTAEPEDLWNALNNHVVESVSNLPANLTTVMENWVQSAGFPLVTVNRVGVSIVITQERFLISGTDNTTRWYVPISYTLSTDTDRFTNTAPREWLTPVGFLEITDLPTNLTWIIVNNQETGFYRVNYDDAMWTTISNALLSTTNFDGIHETNRAQLVDDAFNLARVGLIRYSKTFEIIRFLVNELDYTPWLSAVNGWNFLLRRVGLGSNLGRAMSTHILQLIDNVHNSVDIRNLNETNHLYTLKQNTILTMACRVEHEVCVNTVMERFGEYRITRERPHRNLRGLIYCNGLRYTTVASDWNMLWEAYQTTDLANEQSLLLSALGCSQNETHLENFLAFSLDPNSGIRSQDASSVFSAVYSNSEVGIDVAFRFLRENYQLIEERYQSLNALTNLITGIADRFTNAGQLQLLRNFIDTANITDAVRATAENAYTNAQANLDWLSANIDDLEQYYASTPTTSTSTTTTTTTSTTTPTPTTQITPVTPSGASVALTSLFLTVFFGVITKLLS